MKFYEDKPNNAKVEVNTYGNGEDVYYIPKLFNKTLSHNNLIAHIYHNCEDIDSSYICQNAHECGILIVILGWDNSINLCVLLPSHSDEIKFES